MVMIWLHDGPLDSIRMEAEHAGRTEGLEDLGFGSLDGGYIVHSLEVRGRSWVFRALLCAWFVGPTNIFAQTDMGLPSCRSQLPKSRYRHEPPEPGP